MNTHNMRSNKRNLSVDLNKIPPRESSQGDQHIPIIDIGESDDDVIETSPRSFAQAMTNARRTRRRRATDLNFENQAMTTYFMYDMNGHIIQPVDDIYINLEGIINEEISKAQNEAAEPPNESGFICPICLAPFVEEMSTRCGHIFCKKCIKTAISAKGTCPTCRNKVTSRGLIRVFLPTKN
ncbi:uncharacterized protein [Cicer arietinum]|uniref:RING finger protein PFF0165c-like n=1 Tax=Cicer arietinum TaxID=3827 RepID=A0A1S2Z252_CICAR|nr:RING finger protein PFF0165c-like [Cicer arietinum]